MVRAAGAGALLLRVRRAGRGDPLAKRLEDPLDPLAAGAVPLVPVARPPRAYMVGTRGVRSSAAHVDRRASLPVIRPQEPVVEKPEEFEEPLVEEVSDADSTASLAAAREAAAATYVEQGETAEKHEEPADDAAPVAGRSRPAEDTPADEPETPSRGPSTAQRRGQGRRVGRFRAPQGRREPSGLRGTSAP